MRPGKEKRMEIKKPQIAADEHLKYLDELRASGETNMYGAGPYLVAEFGVTRAESHMILGYWMKSFKKRHLTDAP